MIKTIFISITFLFCIQIYSQNNVSHKTDFNISYYPDSMKADDYIRSRCKLDIYYPENSQGFATLIWFHGGGLKEGEKYCPEDLLPFNLCVVSVDYRLSPESKAPSYIQDAAAAVAWVFNNIKDYRGNPEKIFISGHSAGGYLTSMIGLDKQWLEYFGIDANRIAGLIPLSGQMVTHTTIREEMGLVENKIIVDEYAPMNHVRKDAPPLLLITGDRNLDIPGRYEENLYLKRLMEIVGHKETRLLEMQGYGHMMINPALPLLIKEIGRICNEMDSIE